MIHLVSKSNIEEFIGGEKKKLLRCDSEIRFAIAKQFMKSASTRFLLTIFLVSAVCAVLQIIWNQRAPDNYGLENGFVMLGIFALSITLLHLFLLSAAKGDPQAFIRKYMATTVFKFMFYLLVLIIFLLFSKDNKTALILHFLFYYAVFTVLEVGFLYSELSKLKK
jgi:hypothetical protein